MDRAEADRLCTLLLAGNRLKTTPRTGWVQRGIPRAESVADHSHGVALAALLLCDLVDGPVDRALVLTMAILHDLPEAVTGDLSLGASRLLPPGAKAAGEAAAMAELGAGLPLFGGWRAAWERFEAQDSIEAEIVRDADRIDLLSQALVYERTVGTRELEEFWTFAPVSSFRLAASRALVEALAARRPRP
ncbi:MAG TPA: HD domain-containing protein [Candidatus Krumholzibacteria bacterium]|nr:HD domain-containing protein [Candidatus Krumholzibacteria bacterium]